MRLLVKGCGIIPTCSTGLFLGTGLLEEDTERAPGRQRPPEPASLAPLEVGGQELPAGTFVTLCIGAGQGMALLIENLLR